MKSGKKVEEFLIAGSAPKANGRKNASGANMKACPSASRCGGRSRGNASQFFEGGAGASG
jgi:hypothetical protein